MVDREYDINSMVRRVKTSLGDTLATYLYFADGEKHGVTTAEAVSGNSSGVNSTSEITGRRYIGPFTLIEQRAAGANTTTTVLGLESAAPSGGELLYVNNPAYTAAPPNTASPYLTLVYHRDHLAGVRAITKTDGTILEQNDYYPFGLRTTRKQTYITLSQSLASATAPRYLYNGKEKQEFIHNTASLLNAAGSATYTSNYIDYGARFYNPVTLRWTTQDPLAEKYQRYSPYNYCVNNPINFVDPNGMGDFWFNGVIIGNDGIDDNKVYVIKTSISTFIEGDEKNGVIGAGLSQEDIYNTTEFIKSNSGNSLVFQSSSIAYMNSIEIEGNPEVRQFMVNIVSQDNGRGGTKEYNNREYGGYITSTGDVIEEPPGPVMKPGYAYILLNNGDNTSTFHSHPSGELYNYEAGIETISFHVQHPSQTDIDDAKNGTHYVFGRRNKNVYVYTRNGIQAVIPMKNFVNPKIRKTK